MGDYGGSWRYGGGGNDGRRSGSTPTKRSRREYGLTPVNDYEDGPPSRGNYGSSRADRDVGYTPRERAYDDRSSRWRDGDGLGADLVRLPYGGGGLGGSDLGMGPGLGLSGGGGGGLGPLSLGGLPDDTAIMGPGGRLVGLDVGMGGRPGGLSLNGVAPEADVLRGALDVLPLMRHPPCSWMDFLRLLSQRGSTDIFRPFIGFKEVRLVHKDAKRADGGKVVLCFVEFADARCAATALEALQGYKFDETDHDSYVLRLTFARHPGPRGPARDEPYRGGRDRGDDYNPRSRGGRR